MVYTKYKSFKSFYFVVMYITFIVVSIVYTAQLFTVYHPKLTTWQDVASYDFELVDQTYSDDGTLINTYGISTPEQLAGAFNIDNYIQENIDKTNTVYADNMESIGSPNQVKKINNEYVLLNDVNMSGRSWTPTEDYTNTFNGNYHVIKNLTITNSDYKYLGMVQRLGNNGVIKNLFLENINVTNTNSSDIDQGGSGSVAGECYGHIENVTVSGKITGPYETGGKVEGDIKVGGITGALTNNGSIINCHNYTTVSRGMSLGGIVGKMYSGQVYHCYNYGDVSNGGASKSYIGGICGYTTAAISLCVNYGDVTSTSKSTWGTNPEVYAGGIVGYTDKFIDQCANHGDVTAGESSINITYAGGIVGYTLNNVSNCYNKGNIKSNAKEEASTKIISRPENKKNETEKKYTINSNTSGLNLNGTESSMRSYLNRVNSFNNVVSAFSDNIGIGLGYYVNAGNNTYSVSRQSIYGSSSGAYCVEYFSMMRGDYSIWSETKKAYAGGISGYSEKTIENCYSISSVVGGYKICEITVPVWLLIISPNESYDYSSNWGSTLKRQEYSYNVGQYYHGNINGNTQSVNYNNCIATQNSTSDNITLGLVEPSSFNLVGDNVRVEFELNNQLNSSGTFAGERLFLFPTIIWNRSSNADKFGRYARVVKDHATRSVLWWEETYSVIAYDAPKQNQVIYGGFEFSRTNGIISGFGFEYNNQGYYGNRLLSNNGENVDYDFHFCDYYGNPSLDKLKDYFTIIDLNDVSSSIKDLSAFPTGNRQGGTNIANFKTDIVSKDGGPVFKVSKNINDGDPYLANLYW